MRVHRRDDTGLQAIVKPSQIFFFILFSSNAFDKNMIGFWLKFFPISFLHSVCPTVFVRSVHSGFHLKEYVRIKGIVNKFSHVFGSFQDFQFFINLVRGINHY